MTKEEGKKKKVGKRVEKKRKRSEEEEEDEEDEEEEAERRRKRKGKGKERVESETEAEWRERVEAQLMYVERVMCEVEEGIRTLLVRLEGCEECERRETEGNGSRAGVEDKGGEEDGEKMVE